MGARYFSPALGLFISRDPIEFAGGINIYAYCEGDPVNYVDPTGLCSNPIGDIFAQLRSGDVWRQGLSTSGYALGNLLTGGRAFSQYSDRPGFRASQVFRGIGGVATAVAGVVVAVLAVASNSLYIGWAASFRSPSKLSTKRQKQAGPFCGT